MGNYITVLIVIIISLIKALGIFIIVNITVTDDESDSGPSIEFGGSLCWVY